jgi:hypothetical protein
LRYNASSYAVYRAQDDRYKFQQLASFEEKLDWERYWEGQEMMDFRVLHSSWFQVPVLYSWWDHTAGGAITGGTSGTHSNGATNGNGSRVSGSA